MDPISVTTGVLSLLAVCVKTGLILKDFYDSADLAGTKVRGLLTEVESFAQVLQLMNDTLCQESIQTSLRGTGHISEHLSNLSTSIEDGQNTLRQLQETLEKVNKSVSLLDGARKLLRLRRAADEVAVYQQQVRSYRDAMQLTLQTIILWNQVSFRESADQILPNLDAIQQAIRRIALDLNSQISGLHGVIETNSTHQKLQNLQNLKSLENLRKCMRSAASIVSSASTNLSEDRSARMSVSYQSDFGDCFPSEPAETMLRWISSNTVYEFEEERGVGASLSGPNGATTKSLELEDEGRGSDQSDSDGELEAEMCQALLRLGKDKLASEEFEGAERHFRNCLTRMPSNGSTVSLHLFSESKSDIITLLLTTYRHQGKWDDARSLLMEKISRESRGSSKHDQGVLADTLLLVEVLLKKCAYAEALLYGRRALKGYRKLGSDGLLGVQKSLTLLCQTCKAAGNYDQEDAYGAILSDMLQRGSPPQLVAALSKHQPPSRKGSSRTSPLERVLFAERPVSAQSSYTEDTLGSASSWISSSQSTATSVSTKTNRRDSQSLDSIVPSSPFTDYSSTSFRTQKSVLDLKDISVSPRDEGPNFSPSFSRLLRGPDVPKNENRCTKSLSVRSLVPTHDDLRRRYVRDHGEGINVKTGGDLRSLSTVTDLQLTNATVDSAIADRDLFGSILSPHKYEPYNADFGNLSTTHELDDPQIRKASFEETMNSRPLQDGDVSPESPQPQQVTPSPSHKTSIANSSPIVTVFKSQTIDNIKNEPGDARQVTKILEPRLKTQEGVILPLKITLPSQKSFGYPNNLTKDKGPTAVAKSARSRSSHSRHAMRQALTFSALMVNHTRRHLEEDAIEYFRAGKGNPPKPIVPKPRVPIHVSDYELLEWIGTHPDFTFGEQLDTTRVTNGFPLSLIQGPQELHSKFMTSTQLHDLGVFELPEQQNSATGLHGSISTAESSLSQVKSSTLSSVKDETDSTELYYDLNKGVTIIEKIITALSGETLENHSQDENEGYSSQNIIPVQSSEDIASSVASHTVVDDEGDAMLETLMQMGYNRMLSLSALRRYDYNLEKAANYLASEISERSTTPARPMTNMTPVRAPNIPQLRISTASRDGLPMNSSVQDLPLQTPLTFQTLVRLQGLASSSNLRQPHQPRLSALVTRNSESNLIAPVKTHKRSVSLDPTFSNNETQNPNQGYQAIEAHHNSAAVSQQDELSQFSRQLHRPMNPIAHRWQIAGEELPITDIAKNMIASFPVHRDIEIQRSPSGQGCREAIVAGSPNVPAITFSEMLDKQVSTRRKIVICGDAFCGKSSLISQFSKGNFPETCHSAEFEISCVQQRTGDNLVELVLWDTGGDMNLGPFREKEVYSGAHLVMICFSIDSPDSLDNAQEVFVPEVKSGNNSVRYVLVGLKKDLRYDTDTIQSLICVDQRTVTPGQGRIASVKIGAATYLECSAKTGEGIKEVFEAVSSLAMLPDDKLKKVRSFRKLFGRIGV